MYIFFCNKLIAFKKKKEIRQEVQEKRFKQEIQEHIFRQESQEKQEPVKNTRTQESCLTR
jgi:hypothetical protein